LRGGGNRHAGAQQQLRSELPQKTASGLWVMPVLILPQKDCSRQPENVAWDT
jgi:hypothetical protein